MESSLSDVEDEYEIETMMMQEILEDAELAKERVLNIKESIKGHRVLNPRGHGAFAVGGWLLRPWCPIH